MPGAPELHMQDVGTKFRCTVRDDAGVVDISTASALSIKFRKPDGTTATKTASLSTDGRDGKMEYVTVSGDLDQGGNWQYQGIVTIGTSTWHTDTKSEQVWPNI